MNTETKQCQNCKSSFVIEPEDFDFYKKIKVPPPTWCPECRMVRRMMFLNERSFHRRECDLCRKEVISIFPPKTPFPVYCQPCWWSDNWDSMAYGMDLDFSKPFLVQYQELLNKVPQIGPETIYTTLVNSDYCNIASYLKNCYLLFNSDFSEDCAYSTYLEHSKRSLDIYMGDLCELCYDSSNLFKCFKTFFSTNCNECVEVAFSKNLRNCSNCFGCVNLRHKQYYIFNKPYTKETYEKKLKEFDIGSQKTTEAAQKEIQKLALGYPRKYMEGLQNANTTGDYVFNSKNTFLSYEVGYCEDCKYCQFLFLFPSKDSYDVTMWGGNLTRGYECMGVGGGENNVKFSFDCWANAVNLEYCWHILVKNSDLFGCVALRNKQYCILNKQYTKEQYEALIPKIMRHMNDMPYVDNAGRIYRYGEFLPPEFSPFGYNETIAQAFFPLTKEEATQKGYPWWDPEPKQYQITIKGGAIPDHVRDVPDTITEETIGCIHEGKCNEQCTGAFKIIPQELQFYRRMNFSLPRLCPNCRHYERLKQRNPMKLWKRKCMCAGEKSSPGNYPNFASHFHGAGPCPNQFETSYSPDRPEIVYCEACYNTEVV